jgi:hypothetical protein
MAILRGEGSHFERLCHTRQHFNFSTVGQWMWDEIKVGGVPPGQSAHLFLKEIYEATVKITEADAKMAEVNGRG